MMEALSRRQKTALKQRTRDLQKVMEMPEGRRFICLILDLCGYSEPCMGSNTADSMHRMSRRTVAVDMVQMLQGVDDRAIITLMDEAARQREVWKRIAADDAEEAGNDRE